VPKILCVDDEPSAISLKKKILEDAGYSVTPCFSVECAIQELEATKYDAVITDWRFESDSG
jgi:CheY-like chemotaxis protein